VTTAALAKFQTSKTQIIHRTDAHRGLKTTRRTMPANTIRSNVNLDLADDMARFYADPLGFVMYAFPWGEGSLEGFDGPDQWAIGFLTEVGRQVKANNFDFVNPVKPLYFSTASGHGIGKSAMVAWLILWIMSTRPNCKGTVTANTAQQLRSKTWSELAKWYGLCVTKHWFVLNAGSMGSLNMYAKAAPEKHRVDAQTCEERNSEAFAGQHAATSTSFYIFDEASAVPDKIFEVREGGLTDGEPMCFDFGNPTRNTGRFYENMIGRHRDKYTRTFVDSRTVKITNKELFKAWAEAYGEDSDFFKVRVKGEFGSSGSLQFINGDQVRACVNKDVIIHPFDPVVVGVDVARFGDDQSVICVRQGRDAESQGWHKFSGVDTMELAARVVEVANDKKADQVFIDGGGVGGGVVDRCRQLGLDVMEINFGGKATDPRYSNMRAQMWGNMKEAIGDGIRLPDDYDLISDITGLEYGYTLKNQIQLERKEDAKKRGIASPDLADALALTYALPVAPTRFGYAGDAQAQSEYNPYE
jgi:hypothetical protein